MLKQSFLFVMTAAAAFAGPPLVCHRIEIGTAQSLPWRDVDGWDGTDAKYNVDNLATDTVRLLDSTAPVRVRMETLRRAGIYCARHAGLAEKITAALLSRAEGGVEPTPWFDVGYFAEVVRQTSFIYRYDMLPAAERETWVLRGEGPSVDGLPYIEKAIR